MRIALFHVLPSGGAKRALYELTRRLSRSHPIDVYTLSTSEASFCDLRPFAKKNLVYPFTPSRLFDTPFGRLNQLQRWRDLNRLKILNQQVALEIDSQDYEVVFVHPCMWTQAPPILRHLRTPAVYYCAEPPRAIYELDAAQSNGSLLWRQMLDRLDPLIPLYRSTLRRLDWESTRSARTVLVNSKFTREAASRVYGIKPEVCYLGVDSTTFRPLDHTMRQDYVLSVGAIAPHKGFDFLIESLATLPPDARPSLTLVGNAESEGTRQHLESLAKERSVRLSIQVSVSQENLVRWYNEAALFMYAPHNEPFGLAPLEAMACGTPVVGVAEGGVMETVRDGIVGRLVPRDVKQFGKVIAELLADDAQRQSLGDQGVKYVRECWTWDASVARVEEHLRTAAQTQPAYAA